MSRLCTICQHPKTGEIDAALAAGGTIRDIAGQFGVTHSSLDRHKIHVARMLAQAAEARGETANEMGADLLDELEELRADARRIADEAEKTEDLDTALKAVRELARLVELKAKVLGKINEGTTVNVAIVQSPEWLALRGRMLAALEPFPEARRALAAALVDGHA